ncbi:exopolyphosphatase/guanosine-5'-triphosphate,3'-diphosphate pyrophosphatase [Nonlabens xylanidelens]|uniref:Exopolyphosphatase/guanosine-5'-triphosphate, 3'-diphosphate pyrophosphatase n=1 Tax=Nonlabens xylanidelens TaxID=191564 RepID=A0A2S6IGQ8_9FLAO|nr:exopolyphosphatase [Nonlabens xylanidelens]PPK93340.1 exopolyphosphatase/guanosine-5'-triphosphate,3'-diphosphate pyrophosphatase [Nonlabens xylanidelens]PQJ20845.1 exopolyphosphatase [Nonlabens xylanidelens]
MAFEIKKYGAIDIGSNAIRLLIATVTLYNDEPPVFKKTSLVRVPIRLGQDVFVNGKISQENIDRMVDSMKSYQLLMGVHKVKTYKAYATSAMREALNGTDVVAKIKAESGINIEIIDGSHEAAIIAMTDLHAVIDQEKVYLYVDVGGGSTEFTLFAYGKEIVSKSFKIGTVRLINDMVSKSLWDEAEAWIKKITNAYDHIDLIGSGGNINNIFKSSGKRVGKPISYFYLVNYYEQLQNYNYEERVYHLNLNHDRADVIIPACRIYLRAMKWSKAKNIYVPKIGLTDGIIKSIFNADKR